jgi:RNA polymerase sigma factor (sigma-70 family)
MVRMDDWVAELLGGSPDAAWDRFIDRYRRLIFATIRHYVQDQDEVMDVFARVCEALREDNMRRLRTYADSTGHRARFSTWLVTVVRHLTVDWFRHRDGRRRLPAIAESLAPLQRRIFEHVFLARRGHAEAYGLICSHDPPGPTYRDFLVELRNTYRILMSGRQGRLLRELLPRPPEHEPEGRNPAEISEVRERLNHILASLTPEDRVALELYVVDELPAADIARVLGLSSAKTVYNRVYRSLEAMRLQLQQSGISREDL